MASKKFRRIFFWILVLFFIATAPVVIFYARGYRFSFQQGIFIYAGSITIKSNPQKTDILLDKKPVPNKKLNLINNSYHINGIRAGEYLLEVKSPGYNTWTKKITTHSGISTEFWNVVLTKNNYIKNSYQLQGIEKFFISPDRDSAIFTQNENQKFIVKLIDLGSGETEELFSSSDYYFFKENFEKEKENIEWSPQSHKIIIPAFKEEEKHYFIVDIKNKEIFDMENITKTKGLKGVRWDSVQKNSIYYMAENNLYRINLNNFELKLIAENISGYDISSLDIYYFQLPSGIVYRINPENNKIISQVTASPPDDMNDLSYRIIAYDEKRLVIFNESGKLYVYNNGEKEKYFRELSQNASNAHFSDDGKKILYWTNNEINIYFTRDWDVQPQRQENDIKYITRFSEKINNVQWSKDYEHIIFTVGDKIKIIELDHRDNRNLMDIIDLNTDNSNVITDFFENRIYFTDTNEGQTNLYFIDFPEKAGILRLGN